MNTPYQAARFLNGEFLTGRYTGGTGTDWWMLSTFKDGSVMVSTAGMFRTFATATLALEAIEQRCTKVLANRLRTLAMTQVIRRKAGR